MNMKKLVSNPLDPNTWKMFALGQKGIAGTAISTAVLEFGTQLAERYLPQSSGIMNRQITGNAPFLGNISVRDTIVLAPAITAGLRAIKDKGSSRKNRVMEAVAGYGTKVMLRRTGLNPHLLSKGSSSPTNPRVTAGRSTNASNMGVTP